MSLRRDSSDKNSSKQSKDNIDFDFFDDDDGPPAAPKPTGSSGSPERRRNSSPESEPDRNVVKIQAKLPQVENSNNYDDSFESDDDPLSGRKSNDKQLSDTYSASDDERKSEPTRPKTGKNGRGTRRRNSTGDKHESGSADRHDSDVSGSLSESDSYTSDSDMTDVSPLNSPKSQHSSRHIEFGETTTFGNKKPPRPLSGKSSSRSSNYEQLLQPNRDTMNLKLLMQAITEMEGGIPPRTKQRSKSTGSINKFVAPVERKNFSFRNMQVRDIDKENQRLMQKIMAQGSNVRKQKKARKPQAAAQPERKQTTAEVNRMKEQRRIEQENRAMLRRLEGTRPTTTIHRDSLISGYDKHTLHGVPMAAVHPLPKNKARHSPYNLPVAGDFDTSMGSLRGGGSMSSLSGQRSRPQSAKTGSRPSSAKKPARPQSAKAGGNVGKVRPPSAKLGRPSSAGNLDSRPAWED